MKKTLATVGLCLGAALAYATAATPVLRPAPLADQHQHLGKIDMKGAYKTTITMPAAPAPGGNPPATTPQMTVNVQAKLSNESGSGFNDMTLTVRRKKADDGSPIGDPPTGGSGTLKRPGEGAEESLNSQTTTEGTTAHTTFTNIKEWKSDEILYFETEITAKAGQEVTLELLPSSVGKAPAVSAHVDMLEEITFMNKSKSASRELFGGVNDRMGIPIRNDDPTSKSITRLDGTIDFGSETENALIGVYLTAPGSTTNVNGTSSQITGGNSFTLTGFDALKAKASYELILVLEDPLTDETTVTVTAQF